MPNPVSLFRSFLVQKPAPIGIADLSLPTFAGITGVTPNTDGSFTVTRGAASSTKNPLKFKYYVKLGTVSAATLFASDANVAQIEPDTNTSARIFMDPDDVTYFVKGQTYTFGVKALDAFGIEGGPNTVMTATAIASGNFPVVMQSFLDQLAGYNTAYDALNTTHDGLNDTQAANNADQATENTAYGTLNTAHGVLNTALASEISDAHQNNLDQDALNSTYNARNITHGTLNTAQAANNADQAQNNVDMDGLNTTYDTLNDTHAQNNTDQATQNTAFGQHNTDLAAEITQMDSLNTEYDTLNTALASINTDLNQTQIDLQNAVGDIEAAAGNVSAIIPSYVQGNVESTSEVIGVVESVELASA